MNNPLKSIYQKHFLAPLLRELKKGLDPQKFIQAVVAGILIGLFPIYGTTTSLAIIVAFVFRLNQVVVQACNYVLYPVQLLMIVPLFTLGGWMISADDQLLGMIQSGGFWQQLSFAMAIKLIWQGMVGWLVISIPVGATCYFALKKFYHLKAIKKIKIRLFRF